MEQLKNIIQNAQSDPNAFSIMRRHTTGILTQLGMSHDDADKWLLKKIQNKKINNLAKWEQELHDELEAFGVYEDLDVRMKERAKEWFVKIQPYLLKTKTLDLGGGSGEVANLMKSFDCDVTIADVLNWNKFNIPFIQVANNKMDAEDESFDQVVLLTVFHHTDDVQALVKEAFRVAKKRVIFMESVTENLVGYAYGAWIDWFYNRVIHFSPDVKKKINVPCNFLPATGWEQLVWKLTGLSPAASVNVNIYQYLNPENHHLLVYDR
ncbi:MAG: class I SAM-dependent methyltransferase [Candidatus Liptonbacteria bacterium]|nr:class I SAM-dependent methyltransferase [Candidatus Liptonbacteria bacterium]